MHRWFADSSSERGVNLFHIFFRYHEVRSLGVRNSDEPVPGSTMKGKSDMTRKIAGGATSILVVGFAFLSRDAKLMQLSGIRSGG